MPSLSVVIPAFNEEANVAAAIQRVSDVLKTLNPDYEIIVVNDGSRDRTGEIAKSLIGQVPNLRVVEHSPNRGYGGALRAGFAAATKELIAFVPSDNQFDFGEIRLLLDRIDGSAMVSGYRAHRFDPLIRKLNGLGWNSVVRLLFGYLVRDIDCVFKLFHREVLNHVTLDSDGAMIDTEFLAGLRARGYKIAEVPVTHLPRLAGHPTGANLKVIVRAFRDLFRFRLRLWRELALERNGESAPRAPENRDSTIKTG